MADPIKLHFQRLGIGALAGFTVALVKFGGDDVNYAFDIYDMEWAEIWRQFVGYGLASLFPIILGAIGGWISTENSPPKIFWVALTAPVILAAAANGPRTQPQVIPAPGKAGWNFEQLLPISSAYAVEAYAQDSETLPVNPPRIYRRQSTSPDGEGPYLRGFKLFFGYGKDQTRYRVVVASILDYKKAKETAERLNALKVLPDKAYVGERKLGNDYYPVIVNGWLSLRSAKTLRDKVSEIDLGLPDPPYVSIENRY